MISVHEQFGNPLKVLSGGYNSGVLNGPKYAARVTENGHCTIKGLDLPQNKGTDLEDCRLISHNGKVLAAFTEGRYATQPFLAVQRLAELTPDLKFKREVPLVFGDNGAKPEKNWQFFSHRAQLHFVYSIAPKHIVVTIHDSGKVKRVSEQTNDIVWPFGYMAGGTPPVRYKNEWVSFFHSFLPCRMYQRRYFAAAYAFNDDFEVTKVSSPIWVGSEKDQRNIPHPKGLNWAPLVVFPTGCLLEGDTFSVTMGVNDVYDAEVKISYDQIPWEAASAWTKSRQTYWKTTVPAFPCARWERLGPTLGRVATSDPQILSNLFRAPGAGMITYEEYSNLSRQRL